MLNLVLFISISAFVITIVHKGFLYDKLTKLLHDSHLKEWESEGKPYFYGAKDYESLGFATDKFRLKLVWVTPEWIKNDAKATKLLTRLRLSRIASVFIFLIVMLIMMLMVFFS